MTKLSVSSTINKPDRPLLLLLVVEDATTTTGIYALEVSPDRPIWTREKEFPFFGIDRMEV
jgi:hypothetical protein